MQFAIAEHTLAVFRYPWPITNAVVAICVVFVSTAAVGARGVPVSVGLSENTTKLVPVSFVSAAAKLAELGVARNVATPVPRPDTPVLIGRPVQFVSVPEVGVPRTGVTRVGVFANTSAPEPVSSVMAASRLAELGVAKKVATPVPKPEIPVLTGSPVQFVKVPDVGVPSAGVTRVGLLAKTMLPEPVVPSLK